MLQGHNLIVFAILRFLCALKENAIKILSHFRTFVIFFDGVLLPEAVLLLLIKDVRVSMFIASIEQIETKFIVFYPLIGIASKLKTPARWW